jgi:hypothetical protein
MKKLERITFDPAVMGGRPCIRGLRVTVGTLVGLLAAGKSREDVLRLYPYLEPARTSMRRSPMLRGARRKPSCPSSSETRRRNLRDRPRYRSTDAAC